MMHERIIRGQDAVPAEEPPVFSALVDDRQEVISRHACDITSMARCADALIDALEPTVVRLGLDRVVIEQQLELVTDLLHMIDRQCKAVFLVCNELSDAATSKHV